MKMIVGLGNPGPKYQLNRHNIGFILVDALAMRLEGRLDFRSEHKALTLKTSLQQERILLVKPQTFMNLSGQSVQDLFQYYDLSLDDLLVVQDDCDLPFQALRFQRSRGHGGHNGIRNIHQYLGPDYARLKLGVSRPSHPGQDVADYLLSDFSKDEQKSLDDFLLYSCEAVETLILQGYDRASNQFNRGAP